MGAKKGPKMGVPRSIRKRDKKQIMLYKLRMEKGFSQRELADRAGVQREYFMLRKALNRTKESTISLHGKHQRATRKALAI